MVRLKIKRFHEWWLVVNELGFTEEQFKSKTQAEAYRDADIRPLPYMQDVRQKRGFTIRRISKYP